MRIRGALAAVAALLLSSASARATIIACGEIDAVQGGTAVVEIVMQLEGEDQVAGMQADLTFDDAAFAIGTGDCVINPEIGPDSSLAKTLNTNYALAPGRIRNLLLSLDNSLPIHSGLLYTCTFDVAGDAAVGDYTIGIANALTSSPSGQQGQPTTDDCQVTVSEGPTPTPTPECENDEDCPPGEVCVDGTCRAATPTATPIGFCEDDEDCPEGQVCVNNRCVTPTVTPTPIGFCEDDEDCPEGQVCVDNRCVTPTPRKGGGGGGCSCEIDPGAAGGWQAGDALAILLPAALLILRARRRWQRAPGGPPSR